MIIEVSNPPLAGFLKHSIASLLGDTSQCKPEVPHQSSYPLKQLPRRPTARYSPYNSRPSGAATPHTPFSINSLLEPAAPTLDQKAILEQLQRRLELSGYQLTRKHLPRAPRSSVVTRPSTPSLPPTPPNTPPLSPYTFPLPPTPTSQMPRIPVLGAIPLQSPHHCSITTCTSPSCPHKIQQPSSRKPARSSEPRIRTPLTPDQIESLNRAFSAETYLTKARRRVLSEELGLGEDKVRVWFQNQRRIMKKKWENIPKQNA